MTDSQVSLQFQKSIVIDLDHTICRPDSHSGNSIAKYRKAKPIPSVINKMRELKEKGFYIIIHTSRRMKTCNNDVEKVKEAVETLTIQWLENEGVPYDDLVFGKPYATHYYIDDKNLSIEKFLEL